MPGGGEHSIIYLARGADGWARTYLTGALLNICLECNGYRRRFGVFGVHIGFRVHADVIARLPASAEYACGGR